MYLLAANLVLLVHLLFIGVVVLGGLAVLRRPRLALLHIPAAVWGFLVEAMGWYCPLTDLENELLRRAGEAGYTTGFLEQYLLAIIYPEGLTREIQYVLAALVVVINAAVYITLWRRLRHPRNLRNLRTGTPDEKRASSADALKKPRCRTLKICSSCIPPGKPEDNDSPDSTP